jgi:hypothetical protein
MEDVLVPIVALDIAIVRAPPHPFRFRRQVPFARVAVGDQPRLDLGLTVVRAIIRPADNDRPAATAWASGLAEPGPAPSEALITPPASQFTCRWRPGRGRTVASLNQPGGNATGTTIMGIEVVISESI